MFGSFPFYSQQKVSVKTFDEVVILLYYAFDHIPYSMHEDLSVVAHTSWGMGKGIHAAEHPCIREFMHPCIYASVHPCMHASVHPCIHASVYPCIRACMHPCIRASVHACIHASVHPCIHAWMQGGGGLRGRTCGI